MQLRVTPWQKPPKSVFSAPPQSLFSVCPAGIRGTDGLVDGVRSVYALWNPKEMDAKTICKTLGESFERGHVVMGGVVKANGRANLKIATFLRDTRGNDETQCLLVLSRFPVGAL
jgi:hypothetical protein